MQSNDPLRDDFNFCIGYLTKVSRTFAINIGVLRGNTYKGILLAYLLCRIADTIEDDLHFPVLFKTQKLREFSDLFPPPKNYQRQIERFLSDISFKQRTETSVLVINILRVFHEFVKLPDSSVSIISKHVKEMALGMANVQEKRLHQDIVFMENQSELEQYCYFVAGTVGLMVTAIFLENSQKISREVKQKLESRSVPFGLGLQVTNIAKDFIGDRKRGWYYVPRSFFIEEGIDPLSDSLPDRAEALLNVQKRLINLALSYLDEALKYTLDIPRTLIRYRLFCVWPLFMAVRTLAKLCAECTFVTGKVTKIGRDDVKRITRSTSLAVLSNRALKFLYYKIRPVALN